MVNEVSKLMLRAYNADADHAVRTMRAYKLDSALQRLDTTRATIARLGTTMTIGVTDERAAFGIGVMVAELYPVMDIIADRLNPWPAFRRVAEQRPGKLSEPIGFAVAAAQKIDQHLIGQIQSVDLPDAVILTDGIKEIVVGLEQP